MQIDTFDCPRCGAAIKLSHPAEKTITCPFCNSSVIVPKELRSTAVQPQVVISTMQPEDQKNLRRGILGALGITTAIPALAGCLGLIVALAGVGVALYFTLTPAISETTIGPILDNSPLEPSPTPGYAELVLTFGGEGTGPGLMEDARSIAVDSEGNIYVAQYLGGRVQQFDSTGKYLTQFLVDPKLPLSSMAVDRQGILLIVQRGAITRYQGGSGTVDSAVIYPADLSFEDISLAPDGGLVTSVYQNRDDIVVLAPDGSVTRTIEAAISGVSGDSELDMKVAMDGLGNIYALGTFNDAVFKFGPDGKFMNRFGEQGDEPGQFTAPSSIAVDGQSRVYITDFKGVQVFSSDGRYLGVIDVDGAASGLAFDAQGALYVVARTHVYKYLLH